LSIKIEDLQDSKKIANFALGKQKTKT